MNVKVEEDFSPILRNRNSKQTDGRNTGEEFREKFLSGEVDTPEWWQDRSRNLEIDFTGVSTLGPSWANEVFAYFTKFDVDYRRIKEKFSLKGLDELWEEIIQEEVEEGYRGDGWN